MKLAHLAHFSKLFNFSKKIVLPYITKPIKEGVDL